MGLENLTIFSGKKVFITGITGFKGSWLAFWLLRLGAEVKGFALPPDTHPSHFDLLGLPCETVFGDIRDLALLKKELDSFNPDVVFHLAAQPLVRKSYSDPILTYSVNVMGTLNLLEACKNTNVRSIVVVTSDKVYDNKEWIWPYRETDALGGYDPYSSSKACTEILTSSYQKSFFPLCDYGKSHTTLIATARAGNVIGGGDWSEDRLIPDIVRAMKSGNEVQIRNPNATRPWQHVLEPLAGYLLLAAQLYQGKSDSSGAWNFGPATDSIKTVADVTTLIKNIWSDLRINLHSQTEKLHEAKLLSVDSSKAGNHLNWSGKWDFSQTINQTIHWYKDFADNSALLTESQLIQYENDWKAN